MSSSYFGNVAAAATGGWGATTAAAMPHHQEQFYLHQNCAKYGYSESQYYGHQYQHHHQANPAATTPSPPFRYAPHGYPPQPAAMSFQCSTTLAPVKQSSLESSCTSPAASSSSSSAASPSHDQPTAGSLYGFAQHQLDSFQQHHHHHRHALPSEVAVQQHHQQASGSVTGSLESVGAPYDLHRGFASNVQQQQHHQAGPYCIKNTNASSYFPSSWMQAYAGNNFLSNSLSTVVVRDWVVNRMGDRSRVTSYKETISSN